MSPLPTSPDKENGNPQQEQDQDADPPTRRIVRAMRQQDLTTLLSLLVQAPQPKPRQQQQQKHPLPDDDDDDDDTKMAWHVAYHACRLGQTKILHSLLRLGTQGLLLVTPESMPLNDAVVTLPTSNNNNNDNNNDDDDDDNETTTTTLLYTAAAANAQAADCVQLLLDVGRVDPWQAVVTQQQQPTTTTTAIMTSTERMDWPLWQACRYGRLEAVQLLWQACCRTKPPPPPSLSSLSISSLSPTTTTTTTTISYPTLFRGALRAAVAFGHASTTAFLLQQDRVLAQDELFQCNNNNNDNHKHHGGASSGSVWFPAAWAGHVPVLHVLYQAARNIQQQQQQSQQQQSFTNNNKNDNNNNNKNDVEPNIWWYRDALGGTPWHRALAGLRAGRTRVWQDFVALHCTPAVVSALILDTDVHGETVLCTAAWDDCRTVLEWLLQQLQKGGIGGGVQSSTSTNKLSKQTAVLKAIFHAVDNGQALALECLLPHYAGTVEDKRDVEKDNQTCIEKAILMGVEENSNGSSSSSSSGSSRYRGLGAGYQQILRLLVGPRYQYRVTNEHLRKAAQLGRVEMMHILVQAAPDELVHWSNIPKAASVATAETTNNAASVIASMPTPVNLLQKSVLLCQAGKQSHLQYIWDLINVIVQKGQTEQFDHKNDNGRTARDLAIFAKNYAVAAVLNDPLLTCQSIQDVQAILDQGMITELAFSAPRMRPPKGWTCLHTACCLGRSEIVGYLLTLPKVNVTAATTNGMTPLHWAARHGYTLVCRRLLAQYTDPTVQRSLQIGPASKLSPIFQAARHGHAEIVQMMLDAKCFDVNAVDENDNSALFMATAEGHEQVVEFFLSQSSSSSKVELDVINREGETCLQRACLEQHEGIVRRLLQAGAKTSVVDKTTGDSALHYAAACGFGETGCRILALLLDHGANLDLPRQDGWTALHCAIWGHNDEMFWQEENGNDSFPTIKLLFHWGASLDVLDSADKTPMDLAAHPTLRLYLESLQRERKGTGRIYNRKHKSV